MAHYREAVAIDCISLGPRLRSQDVQELKALHPEENPTDLLIESFESSIECNSIIDDQGCVVGMFGVVPTQDPLLGIPWLLCSEGVYPIARQFIRGCKPWVNQINEQYPLLYNQVDKRNTVAIQWLKWLGFQFINEVRSGANGEYFYPFVRINKDYV